MCHLGLIRFTVVPVAQITTSCSQLLWQYVKAGKIGDNVAAELGGQMKEIQNNFFSLYATTEQPVSRLGCASFVVENAFRRSQSSPPVLLTYYGPSRLGSRWASARVVQQKMQHLDPRKC